MSALKLVIIAMPMLSAETQEEALNAFARMGFMAMGKSVKVFKSAEQIRS